VVVPVMLPEQVTDGTVRAWSVHTPVLCEMLPAPVMLRHERSVALVMIRCPGRDLTTGVCLAAEVTSQRWRRAARVYWSETDQPVSPGPTTSD
jgi:hypothetical protein